MHLTLSYDRNRALHSSIDKKSDGVYCVVLIIMNILELCLLILFLQSES